MSLHEGIRHPLQLQPAVSLCLKPSPLTVNRESGGLTLSLPLLPQLVLCASEFL